MDTLTVVNPTTGNEPDAKKRKRAIDLMTDAGNADDLLKPLQPPAKQHGGKPKPKGTASVEKPVSILSVRYTCR
jgi:hypothetical protein